MRAAPQRCLRAGASVPRAPAAMVPRRAIAVAAPARPAPTPSFSFAPVASPFFFPSARTSSYFIPPTTLPQRPAVENFWLPTPAASPFSVPIPKNAPVTEVPAAAENNISLDLLSTKRRRVKKMAKHQYRKRLKAMRLEMRRLGQK